MDDTLPLIGANNNHFLNYTGSGWSIAILDTGVQKSHPALFGKVISEACYSSNVSSQGASSLCPGGATSSTATNSGLNCASGITGCDHGTHVAGIAARVAPGAWLIPIQVFSRFTDSGSITPCQNANRTSPCTLSYSSDQIAGLNRVWALHVGNPSINVAAANMSLGGGQYAAPCDALPEFNTLRLAIQQLRDQNVATVIAAGNSGYRNAMAAPACLTPAISVAASDKNDQVASFSNISSLTHLIAPGTPILAPVPTSMIPIYQVRGGTSMAAPHVAGAIATFKEAQPNATVPQIITALTTSGPNITDQRSGGFITKRRLNTWGALCA
jgi:subtilisin family serine protease